MKYINLQILLGICGYELPTNLQNFKQIDLTEVKIFLKVLDVGLLFLKPPVGVIFIMTAFRINTGWHSTSPVIDSVTHRLELLSFLLSV